MAIGPQNDQEMISVYIYTDIYELIKYTTLSNKLLNIVKLQIYVLLRQSPNPVQMAIPKMADRLSGNRFVNEKAIDKKV